MTSPSPTRGALAAVLLGLLVLLAPGTAAATTAPEPPPAAPTEGVTDAVSWSVRPSEDPARPGRTSYAYEVDPGAVVQDGMVVTNKGAEDLTLTVYAADGVTTASGHLDLQPADVAPTDVGSWVSVDTPDLTLTPGESLEVGFTIEVPADAAPGDHSGGIVASLSSAESGDQGPVQLDRRLGSRINVRVSGEERVGLTVDGVRLERDGGWNPLTAAPTTLTYRLTNTGNVRTLGYADVTISGPLDLGAARALETVPEILPGNSLERTVALPGSHPWGRLDAQVTVTPESVGGPPGEAVSASTAIWAVPWAALVGVLVLAGLILLLVLRRHRRRARLSAR